MAIKVLITYTDASGKAASVKVTTAKGAKTVCQLHAAGCTNLKVTPTF